MKPLGFQVSLLGLRGRAGLDEKYEKPIVCWDFSKVRDVRTRVKALILSF